LSLFAKQAFLFYSEALQSVKILAILQISYNHQTTWVFK